MPPLLEQQQLKEALKTMKVTEPVPYKKTKFELTPSPSTSGVNTKRKSTDETPNRTSSKTNQFSVKIIDNLFSSIQNRNMIPKDPNQNL